MRKTVRVTRKNIKQGRRGDGYLCPIARALKSTFPEMVRISVGDVSARYYPQNGIYQKRAGLPIKVQKFVLRFDAKKPVKPFSFSISL